MQRARILVSLLVLSATASSAWAGNPFAGKDIYNRHCAKCHGDRGESQLIGVPNFARGEVVISSTDPMLLETIRNGKRTMPGFRGLLKDNEILDVISYMRTLF